MKIFLIPIIFLSSCVSNSNNSLHQYHHKKTFTNIEIPKDYLNCNCHTQGIAWDDKLNQLIITCKGSDNKSHIALFSYDENDSIKFVESIATDAEGRGFSHPSATQIHNSIFPVAIAAGKNDSAIIQFYSIKERKIKPTEIPKLYYPNHIGAISMFTWNGKTYLFGVGWDSKEYALWRSENTENLNFELINEGDFSQLTDFNFGAYNSLWIGLNFENELELFASAGSFINKNNNFIDIYSIQILNNSFSLKNKERIYVKGITENTTKSLFFEGVTIKNYKKDTIEIIAAPQDFLNKNDVTVLKNLYEGIFIKSKP